MSDHKPAGEWLPLWKLVAYYANDRTRLDDTRLDDLKRTWIDDLDQKRVHYRYQLAANGEHGTVADDNYYWHADDLPKSFWRLAHIHWPWNSATWGGQTIVNIEVFVGEAESLVGEFESRNGTPRPEPAMRWIERAVKQERRDGENVTSFAHRLERKMLDAVKAGECQRRWTFRTIVNRIRDHKL